MTMANTRDQRYDGRQGIEVFYRQWPDTPEGQMEIGNWVMTVGAVYGPEDPETLDRPIITPAEYGWEITYRDLTDAEKALWAETERNALTPSFTKREADETIGLLVEDAFKHQRQGEYAVGNFGQLLAILAERRFPTATEVAALMPTPEALDAIRETARAEVRQLDANPKVKEVLVEQRLREARGMA